MTLLWYNESLQIGDGSAAINSLPPDTAKGLATYPNDTTQSTSDTKRCTKCGELKPRSDYHKFGGGLRPTCKACTNAQNRAIYRKNHAEHLESKRRYRLENPDARRETVRKYDQTHRAKRNAHVAVKLAIYAGTMPPASECQCVYCGAQAETYHHPSYAPEYRLDVIPLCRQCHGREHQRYE